jgi:putative redox protein
MNRVGYRLSGLLDKPDNGKVLAYALFAHCFTCGKDLKPFARMNEAITARGIGVLRFDFSGLGRSEGEFTDSNLSSNESDLVDAANYLKDNFEGPKVLIGHSMGGSAVLRAAKHVASVKAVVTIGTPAEPSHLGEKLARARDTAIMEGKAEVMIGGQKFTLLGQFFEDLDSARLETEISKLDKPLLILHSPADRTVDIENASRIFQAARHPKSFVSLNRADHLMLEPEDARYAGDVIAAWAMYHVLR